MVHSSMNLDAKLHKTHISLSFHQVGEAIAAKVIGFYHLNGDISPGEISSKPRGY